MTLPVLTPRQVCERLIANDERNVAWASRNHQHIDTIARVIADCAQRLFEARAIDRELERRAEKNLRDALKLWAR